MKLKIFFSWEMETDSQGFDNKNFLIVCISHALDELKKQHDFKNVEFEFQEGLSGVGGTPRVAEMMMKRAKECDIFIGDMTIAQRLGELTKQELAEKKSFMRYSPNANVLMEYAIAYNKDKDFWEQVVLIMNKINGDVHDKLEYFPFDIREERFPITFELRGDAQEEQEKKVTNILIEPLRLAVKAAIKRHNNKFKPLQSWEDQEGGACYSGQYEWTAKLEEYKNIILDNNNIIRLIGLSGHGKTRLVAESYRRNDSREMYLYGDMQLLGEKEIYSLAMRVFEEFPEATLVIDNCNYESHKMLMKLRKASHVKTKLITIYYDPTEKPSTDYINLKMEEYQKDVVEKIFRSFRDFKDEEEHFYFLEATGGIPMIAEQIVKVLKEGNDNGRIDDSNYITKLLGCDEASEEREALRALSLFTELEYDDKSTEHKILEFVAKNKNILSVTKPDAMIVNWIIGVVRTQIKRGTIEKTGTIIRIRPQRLRDGLLAEWAEQCDDGRLMNVITDIDASAFKDQLTRGLNSQLFSLISSN